MKPEAALELEVVESVTLVRKLRGLAPLLEPLRESQTSTDPAYVPRSTREAIGRQFVQDRHAQLLARSAGFPETLGNTHSPGNKPVVELLVVMPATLHDVRRRILIAHHRRGTCAIPHRVYGYVRPSVNPRSTTELVIGEIEPRLLFEVVEDLVLTVPTVSLARDVNRDLGHLVEQAERLVDGDDRVELNGACPHCHHKSLVTYKTAGIIRCERPRGVRCRCSDPFCGCRLDPTGFIHTWYRAGSPPEHPRRPGDRDSWESLSFRLNAARRARTPARKAPRP